MNTELGIAMATDWSFDVRRLVPNADAAAIAGIIRHCGVALQRRDAASISFSDPAQVGRLREGFLKRTLGLTLPDLQLNRAILEVGERLKSDSESEGNRVTVYYLLAERFNLLGLFARSEPIDAASNLDAIFKPLASITRTDGPAPRGANRAALEPVRARPVAMGALVPSGVAVRQRDWKSMLLVLMAMIVLAVLLAGGWTGQHAKRSHVMSPETTFSPATTPVDQAPGSR